MHRYQLKQTLSIIVRKADQIVLGPGDNTPCADGVPTQNLFSTTVLGWI